MPDRMRNIEAQGVNGIPGAQLARHDQHNKFINYLKKRGTDPSMGNLYAVSIAPPGVFQNPYDKGDINNSLYRNFVGGTGNEEMRRLINMYATAVNLPSKQMTTGQIVTIGSPYKYVTGTAYSQISITFMMPRNHSLRMLFEAWMNMIISDANQYVEDYDEYVCPYLRIYKFERGFGDKAYLADGYDEQLNKHFIKKTDREKVRLNELTACFELRNAFPYNIGSAQLNNNDSRLLTYSIGFNFERYRFFPRNNIRPKIKDYANIDNQVSENSRRRFFFGGD